MKTTINLLQKNQVLKRRLRKYFFVSLGIFFVIFAVTAGLYIYSIVTNIRLSSLSSEESDITTQINSFSSKKDKALLLQERLGSIRAILSQRKEIPSDIESLKTIIPPRIEVSSLSAKDGESSFRLSSADLADLNSLIEQKIAEVTGKEGNNIEEVVISSFILDSESLEYGVTLRFVYKE